MSDRADTGPLRVAFFGSPAFAVPVLDALCGAFEVVLVVAQPDKPVGRGLRMTPPPVAARATELGLPLAQSRRLRHPDFGARLRDSGADVAVTCAYGRLLPAAVLGIPHYGFLNAHTSLLPRYRGAAPIQWALIQGETVTGTTIMQTDEGMDTGPVLLQRALPVAPEWTAHELSDALSAQAAALMVEALRRVGALTPTPQDHAQATHAPLLVKEDGFVRWTDPAPQVVNRARGVAVWPQTTAFWRGTRLKLSGLSAVPGAGAPGEVLGADASGLTVACAQGAVRVQTVQPEARKVVPAHVWAAGAGAVPGTRLDLWTPAQ